MTREEQLSYCKICENQKFDLNQGIICGLTNKRADFKEECPSFVEDSLLKIELSNQYATKQGASQGKRFTNYIIDFICFLIFSFVFGAFLGIIIGFLSPSSLSIFEEDNIFLNYLINFIAGMIYYTTLEAITGRTVAKFITKTKVVTVNGEKPDFNTILIRSLCRHIPFNPLSFLGSDASGWHDKLSKTKVIDAD